MRVHRVSEGISTGFPNRGRSSSRSSASRRRRVFDQVSRFLRGTFDSERECVENRNEISARASVLHTLALAGHDDSRETMRRLFSRYQSRRSLSLSLSLSKKKTSLADIYVHVAKIRLVARGLSQADDAHVQLQGSPRGQRGPALDLEFLRHAQRPTTVAICNSVGV